jgi:hypothetical protein
MHRPVCLCSLFQGVKHNPSFFQPFYVLLVAVANLPAEFLRRTLLHTNLALGMLEAEP